MNYYSHGSWNNTNDSLNASMTNNLIKYKMNICVKHKFMNNLSKIWQDHSKWFKRLLYLYRIYCWITFLSCQKHNYTFTQHPWLQLHYQSLFTESQLNTGSCAKEQKQFQSAVIWKLIKTFLTFSRPYFSPIMWLKWALQWSSKSLVVL